MKNFIESTIPNSILQRMDMLSFFWRNELSETCVKSLIESMARFLSIKKSKDKTVAVVLKDLNDNFVFAAYSTFVPQTETGADDGSYSINYTYDEHELNDKTMVIYEFNDPEMRAEFENTAYIKDGLVWKFHEADDPDRPCEASSVNINAIIMNTIREYMESNVNFDNQLNINGYMIFTAEIESGGNVYISCEPSPVIKQFMKDDNSIRAVE